MVLPESNIVIHNVGLNPTRSAVLDVLGSMGAPISLVSVRSRDGELVGDIAVRHEPLKGGVMEGDVIAQLIDELPAIAVLGPYTEQGIEIRNAAELRVKESDRIAALAENLRRMGAQVEERPDGLRVEGRSAGRLHGAEIDPHGDHRMAMAFAVAALGRGGRHRHSRCGMRRGFVSRFFRHAGAASRAIAPARRAWRRPESRNKGITQRHWGRRGANFWGAARFFLS